MNAPIENLSRRKFLQGTGITLGIAAMPSLAFSAAAPTPEEERTLIEKALPAKAQVSPRKLRKLLIFELNVGYGGHSSIPTASLAFKLMGEKTKAYETVISRDPAIFTPASLKQFDAVFLNNTVGNLFTEPTLRESLLEFVCAGGGLLGVHGTSVAFMRWPGAIEDWPEFGVMLGARGANHRDSDEHVFIKLDDAEHPVNQVFDGKGFEYRDEFFRVHEPYSRKRVRVLFSIDMQKTKVEGQARGNCSREDNDYALAWVRQYGRGRTFYCTIAHNPSVFWDAKMLQFYMDAIQFALGDLKAPTIPSARLTPALAAQERLGWRLGLPAEVFPQYTLLELIHKAAELGLLYIGASDRQGMMHLRDRPLDRNNNDDLKELRLTMDTAGVRLLTYHVTKLPSDPEGLQKLFVFGRKLGIETFMGHPQPEDLDLIEKLCDEFDINFALYDPNEKSAQYGPQEVLKLCDKRSLRLGVCGNLAFWSRAGLDPIETLRKLQHRCLTLHVHDLHEGSRSGHDVVWGTGSSKLKGILEEVSRLGLRPTMFGLDYRTFGPSTDSDLNSSIKFFNKVTVELARR